MKRVLIAHPYVTATGGANAVAAWALQALRGECQVSLATLSPIDYAAVNRSFGTSLKQGDVAVFLAPARYHQLLRVVRTPGALLEHQLTVRLARNIDRKLRFDVLLSTHNEVDFGRRGIQYVNLPGAYLPRPDQEVRWSHRIPGLHRAFRAACQIVGRSTAKGPLRNVFVADSYNIARRIREMYGVESRVLYPPVPGEFPQVPWQKRRAGFVAIGRITTCKRWEMAVAILDELRSRGHDLTLTLIGHREDSEYERRLRSLTSSRPWFRMVHDLSRVELVQEIASHRYGIHTMQDEHFGIAPAEILSAGCLPFVHNSGGPVEIVDGNFYLTFETIADAVEKISMVLRDPDLERRLLDHTAQQKSRFTTESFCSSLREIVRVFA